MCMSCIISKKHDPFLAFRIAVNIPFNIAACLFAGVSQREEQSNEVQSLLQSFTSNFESMNVSEMKHSVHRLKDCIKTKTTITPERLREYAWEKRNAQRYSDANALFCVAACLSAEKLKGQVSMRVIILCLKGMKEVSLEMLHNKVIALEVVKGLVIPLMHEVKEKMEEVVIAKKDLKCKLLVNGLNHISTCEAAVGQLNEAMATIEYCLSRMDEQFGEESSKQRVYGGLLYDIGNLYKSMFCFSDARQSFEKAKLAYKAALDIDNVNRKYWLDKCEKRCKECDNH